MDLPKIENYLCPQDFTSVQNWGEDWAWLAGGTWLFSEPQPHLKTLVEMQDLGWSELEISNQEVAIGATCTLKRLQELNHPEYPALKVFKLAISALAASWKVVNVATVGGNLCLALAVGTLAPVMIVLGAKYELINPMLSSHWVEAKDFQTGIQKTLLQSGEVLRKVVIPANYLQWQISYDRFGIAATDPALAIVVVAYHAPSQRVRIGIGASVPAPKLLEFDFVPDEQQLDAVMELDWLEDARASSAYRCHLTKVLVERSLKALVNF